MMTTMSSKLKIILGLKSIFFCMKLRRKKRDPNIPSEFLILSQPLAWWSYYHYFKSSRLLCRHWHTCWHYYTPIFKMPLGDVIVLHYYITLYRCVNKISIIIEGLLLLLTAAAPLPSPLDPGASTTQLTIFYIIISHWCSNNSFRVNCTYK